MSVISVITICFNNLAALEKTCASVDMQNSLPFEHLIINGSTTDDVQNWLMNTSQPSYRKWINELDNGIADAFNKGINAANSEITHLLNSGDLYASNDVLDDVQAFFSADTSIQWISGNIKLIRSGNTIIVGKPFEKNKLYRGMRSISHPTWFVKKEVYARIGLYSSDYRIAMDYDLLCRINNEPYAYLNKVITIFDDSGVSSIQYLPSLQENKRIYESYFGFSWRLVFWQLRLTGIHNLLQTQFGKWLYDWKVKMGFENV